MITIWINFLIHDYINIPHMRLIIMCVDSCESMINPWLVKLEMNYDAHLLFNTMCIYYAHQVLDKLSMWTIKRMKSCQVSLCASYIMQVFVKMPQWMNDDQVHSLHVSCYAMSLNLCYRVLGVLVPDNLAYYLEPWSFIEQYQSRHDQ